MSDFVVYPSPETLIDQATRLVVERHAIPESRHHQVRDFVEHVVELMWGRRAGLSATDVANTIDRPELLSAEINALHERNLKLQSFFWLVSDEEPRSVNSRAVALRLGFTR